MKKGYIFISFIIFTLVFIRNPFSMGKVLSSPSFYNILGTDNLGRDIFTRLILGTFNTLIIVFISIILASIVGVFIGLLSGYYGSYIDKFFQTFVGILLSIPSVLIAITVVVVLKVGFFSIIFAMFLMYLPLVINYARGLVIAEKNKDYITAAKTYGVSNIRIIIRHIFPNIKKYILVNFGVNFSKGILTEAGLGFLGIGLDPSIPTLGNMLNASQSYFLVAPLFTIITGIVIIILVYYINKISSIKGIKYVKRNKNKKS